MTRRRIRNETFMWITLLLLQECRVSLMINLHNMRMDSQSINTKTENNIQDKEVVHDNHLIKRPVNDNIDVSEVMGAVRNAGDLYMTTNPNWAYHIKDRDCNANDEENIRKIWSENGALVLSLYLSSYAVMSYMKGCTDLMRYQVEQLIAKVGKTDALDHIKQVVDVLKAQEVVSDDDDGDDDDDDDDDNEMDPEGSEISTLNEATFLLARNIDATEGLSDIFLSFNDSSKPFKSFAGLDELLDDSINGYLVMSSLLQDASKVRRKRKTSIESPKISKHIHQYQKRAIERYASITKRSVLYGLSSQVDLAFKHHADVIQNDVLSHHIGVLKKIPQVSKHFKQKASPKFAPFSTLVRIRRQISSTDNSEIIFIKNAKYPCMLLTFQGGEMSFVKFDELSIYSQLWVVNGGHLQHYETGFFLTKTADGRIKPEDLSLPVTEFQFINGTLIISEASCTVTTNTGNELTLQSDCNEHSVKDIWTAVTLQESQSDIASITCLFVIQRHDSCKVLTSYENTLALKHIDEENIIHQLWYWDHEYIRHGRTHNYLTSDWMELPLTLAALNDGIGQRWMKRDDTLEAIDLPQDSVLILGDETIRVGFKDDTDKHDWYISLVQLRDGGVPSCKNTGYFAIKHDDVPCLVMCVQQLEAELTLMTKLLVIGLALCTGILSGLLFLICFKATEALICGTIVGIILASTAALVLYVSPPSLSIKYLTVYFDEFNDSEPGNCLWYESDGRIKNVKHDEFFSLETVGSNDFKTLRFTSDSNQYWGFKNRAIRQEGNLCGLALIMDTLTTANSDAALQFKCTNETEKYVKWSTVELSESSNFVKQTTCLYFLRLQNNAEDSCNVITTDNVTNEISIKAKRPSLDHLFNQLWYLKEQNYFNLYSGDKFNLSVSDIDTQIERVAFTDKEAERGYLGGCERTLYFIKSRENQCLLMTYMNESGEEYTNFQEFNGSNIMGHLWENRTDGLRNAISGYRPASYNFTLADSVIFNNDFTSYAEKIICSFFVQEKEPPCRLLTANSTTGNVFFGPFTSDLAESQLWYKSGNIIVHLQTGMSLRFGGSSYFQLAALEEKTIPVAYATHKEGNYTLFIQNGNYNTTFYWRLIYSEDALDDLHQFYCSSNNRTYYFIKQTRNPCVVLTTGNLNKRPFFDTFDDKNVPAQLWYEENERLINLYTGLVLTMNVATGKYVMSPHLFYEPLQNIEIISKVKNTWTHGNMDYNCILKALILNDSVEIMCTEGSQNDAALEFIGYDALDDISNLMCLFYIRSKTRPCEFLTGYDEGARLKIRPLTEQLIQQQLFYSKANYIIHQKSGLFLTYDNRELGLQRGVNKDSYQSWEFNEDFLELKNGIKNISLTFSETDGYAYASDLDRTASHFYWSKVSLDYDFDNDASNNPYCSENIDIENINVFFITSTRETCAVLTAVRLGEVPEFKVYDNDNQHYQMWYFHDKHIVNLATGLVIMVQFDERTDDHDVVMWNKHTFSTAQKFLMTDEAFAMSLLNKTCILSSTKTETSVSINLDCKPNGPSDLKIVHFNDEGKHLDQIMCFFFIKSQLSPCDLLTFVNGDLEIRPLSGEFYEGQLWFWKEKTLINAKSNKMLSVIERNHALQVCLQPITTTDRHVLQNDWAFNNGLIKPLKEIAGISLSVGFWIKTGTVGIERIHFTTNWYQQWTFVNKDEGLKQAEKNMFHCEKDVNHDIYVIRSEHDDCPLLNVVGGSKVGHLKVGDSGTGISDTAWWTLPMEHVCNAQLQLCLAVNNTYIHNPDLQPRYAFDRSQRWTTTDGLIKHLYGPDKLTYTGSQIQLSSTQQGSDKQRWKWFKSSDIEHDPKHLRCSRCYDKTEEKAAEIISWIPFIGLFYNIGRSIAYGVKNCPSVALGALRDALIDFALDAVMVLSAGTASAFALGIKTAIKLGFKAGMKVFANAIKSMVKVAIKSFGKNIIRFAKTGFRRTLKLQITKMKLNIKAVISSLKRLPATIKSFSKSTLRNVKSFVKVSFRSMKSLGKKTEIHWESGLKGKGLTFKETFKSMPGVMKKQLNKLGGKLKKQLKRILDGVSERAELAIKKADGRKMPKKIRCKRGNDKCAYAINGGTTLDKLKTMKEYPDDTIPSVPLKYRKDMAEVNSLVAGENRQSAAVGLRVDGKDALSYKDYAKISDDGLLDTADNIVKDVNGHTEPYLLNKLDVEIKKQCSAQRSCQVYVFTKMSPCHERKDLQEACLSVISKKCTEWLQLYSTKCMVSFDKVYQTSFPFSGWTDVLKQTVRDGRFPSMTKNSMKGIDEVLNSREYIESLSSVVKSDFDKILAQPNIHHKLQVYWPKEIPSNFGSFYKDLNEKTTEMIKNKLNNIDVDAVFKTQKLQPDELNKLNKLKTDMIGVEDTTNYGASMKTTFDDFKKTNPKMIQKGALVYKKMLKTANDELKQTEEIVKSVAIQIQSHLNAIVGKAEVTKIIVDAAEKAGDAVSIYRFRQAALDPV